MTDEMVTIQTKDEGGKTRMFAFGAPEPALGDGRWFSDYLECVSNGTYFETPIPTHALAKSFRANPHHESAIRLKRNLIAKLFKPTPYLDMANFRALVLDYLIFGYGCLDRVDAKTGKPLRFERVLARYVRRSVDLKDFYYLQGSSCDAYGYYGHQGYVPYKFPHGQMYMFMEPDIDQEVYGMPEYISALQSVWLNEAATLFRRKYYINGSHAGYLLYVNDADLEEEDVNALKETIESTKGLGNFKNIFMHSPGGSPKAIQLVSFGEAAAKDEFAGMKNVSRDDVLAAHRVPPQLLGIVPANSGGFGDVGKANETYLKNEIFPMLHVFKAINDELGLRVVDFISEEEALKMIGSG